VSGVWLVVGGAGVSKSVRTRSPLNKSSGLEGKPPRPVIVSLFSPTATLCLLEHLWRISRVYPCSLCWFESGPNDEFESGPNDEFESGSDDEFESGPNDEFESGSDDEFESGSDDEFESGLELLESFNLTLSPAPDTRLLSISLVLFSRVAVRHLIPSILVALIIIRPSSPWSARAIISLPLSSIGA
jgi:hypothetical protein